MVSVLNILLLTGALLGVTFAQSHQYYFVNTSVNWTEAQALCREVYTDLATIENIHDVYAVTNTTSIYTGKAWIGLYDDLENSWRWSLNDSSFYGEGEMTFRNWFPGQPNNNNGKQHCVDLLSGSGFLGTWDDNDCETALKFVCYNETINGTASFVKVDTSLTWTEAQHYCQENHVDLASIRNAIENNIINNLAAGDAVWIGLHRQKVWSDGSSSLFRLWTSGQPDSGNELCVAANFGDTGRWSDEDCSSSIPFVCFSNMDPPKVDGFRSDGQDETSITLQWNRVNSRSDYILQFNSVQVNIPAPGGDGPVIYRVLSLTAGTEYTFTIYSVFGNVRSSGVTITAVTAPLNPEGFESAGQNETSIILQWNKVNNVSFILQFNDTETNITAPDGDGPITHTVSSLTAATNYTFTLYSVFEDVRSSGVIIHLFTGEIFSFINIWCNIQTQTNLKLNKL
ncbi:secretory phospholipase A2 receptor-like [Pholidichthys leucotaenia]